MPKLTEIISGPNRWIKHKSASDRLGMDKDPTDPEACRFCLMGAIRNKTNYKGCHPSLDYDSSDPGYPAFKQNVLKVANTIRPGRDQNLPLIQHVGVIINFNDDPLTTYTQIEEVLTKVEHEFESTEDERLAQQTIQVDPRNIS